MRRWRGSPPGSSSTRAVFWLYWDKPRGQTAHAVSSSLFNAYSWFIFSRVSRRGRFTADVNNRTDDASACLSRPRYRMNSSSSRRSRTAYSEKSTGPTWNRHSGMLHALSYNEGLSAAKFCLRFHFFETFLTVARERNVVVRFVVQNNRSQRANYSEPSRPARPFSCGMKQL